MRMNLLASFTLLCFCLTARADDLFVFRSSSDTLTFTLPGSPTPNAVGGGLSDFYEVSTLDGVAWPAVWIFSFLGMVGFRCEPVWSNST